MKFTDENGVEYETVGDIDSSAYGEMVAIRPIKKEVKLWRPKGDHYFYVDEDCYVINATGYVEYSFNVYRTQADAEYAAKVINRTHAIIAACRQVDPEFVQDFNRRDQVKFFPAYTNAGWEVERAYCFESVSPAFVSSEEKAQQVLELLKPLNLFNERK